MHTIIEYTVTAVVCLITAVVIQRIFIKEKRRRETTSEIQGIKWFGLAIFAWGVGALVNAILTIGLGWQVVSKFIIYWGVFISLANSLFIILSLPSIEHGKKRSPLVRLVNRFSVKEFIGLYTVVLGMIAFVFVATSYDNETISNNFIWLIDIPISILVAISLLYELNNAFSSRNMRFMYLPTIALFLLILVAVTHRIIPQDRVLEVINQNFWAQIGSITAISFKFLFILLFSILLYSWKFLTEKEAQQSLAQQLEEENKALGSTIERLDLANESHLDTIKTLKKELEALQEASKIELSLRQKEVLGNLASYGNDKSYTELAEAMHISVDGLQTHIHQIKKLLNISGSQGKEQLIAFAKEHGLEQYATL